MPSDIPIGFQMSLRFFYRHRSELEIPIVCGHKNMTVTSSSLRRKINYNKKFTDYRVNFCPDSRVECDFVPNLVPIVRTRYVLVAIPFAIFYPRTGISCVRLMSLIQICHLLKKL